MAKLIKNKKATFRIIIAVAFVIVIAVSAWLINSRQDAPIVQAGWFNEDWYYRRQFVVDQDKIGATLTNFPVAVQFTSTGSNPYSGSNSDGSDLRFTDYQGNLLKYEIEQWDESGTSTVWVKLPSVASTTPTNFYMYYGNPSATDAQQPTEVWDDNYVGVWHLDEATSTATDNFKDSTQYTNHGTLTDTDTDTAPDNGKYDGAVNFAGDDDEINVGSDEELDALPVFTWSAWIYPETWGSTNDADIMEKTGGNIELRLLNGSSEESIRVFISTTGDDCSANASNSTISLNSWQYVAVTLDSTGDYSPHLYVNGEEVGYASQSTCTGSLNDATGDLRIGAQTNERRFDGTIDNPRVSNTARSSSWFKATYYNGLGTLLTDQGEEQGPGPVGYWKFDEGYGTTAYDDSPFNHDGTISGAPRWADESHCRHGKCLYFDGTDDYINVASSTALNMTRTTISAWVKTTTAGNYILAKANSGGSGNVDRTGYIQSFTDQDDNGNVDIDIPADAEIMVVGVGAYYGEANVLSSYPPSLGQTTSTLAQAADSSTAAMMGSIFYVVIPQAWQGTTKAFQWDWGFGGSWTAGARYLYAFYKGVDTSSPIGDTGGEQDTDGDFTTGALTVGTGDMLVGHGVGYNATLSWANATASSTTEGTYNSGVTEWAETSNTGEITVTVTRSGGDPDGNVAGLVLKAGSLGNVPYALGTGNGGEFITASSSTTYTAGSTVNINDGEWHYVAGTYDGSVMKIYVDGNLAGSDSSYGLDLPLVYKELHLGAHYLTAPGDFFQGYMDEIKIYNYARTAAQIKADYNQGFAASFGTNNPEASLNKGLLGWWQFDETATTSGAFDASGRGNTGSYLGVASTTADGKFGRAFKSDGLYDSSWEEVMLESMDDYDDLPAMTLSAWVYATGDGAGGWGTVAAKTFAHSSANLGIPGWALGYNGQTPDIFRLIVDGSSGDMKVSANTEHALNQWYHVAVTWDGSLDADNVFIYINGVDDTASRTDGSGSRTSDVSYDFAIGGSDDATAGAPWEGNIDDFRIYNRVLSPDEVRRLYEWAPGPVAHWKFDEGQGTTAYDTAASTTFTGGNHGTFNGAPQWTRGKYGSSLDFDGTDDYVEIPDNDNLDLTGNFTIMAWIKPESWGQNDQGRIIDHGAGSAPNSGWTFQLDMDWQATNGLTLQMQDATGGFVLYSDSNVVEIGEWQHVAVTFTANDTAVFYVNGQASGSNLGIGTVTSAAPAPDAIRIGIRSDDLDRDFDGLIDDVKIYDYARTPRQILEDMHAGQRNNPIGYWSFDEGQGTTAYDSGVSASTGSANNGTLTNMSTSGTSTAWTAGKSGKALQFDGSNDYVDLGTPAELNLTTQFSVSAWVKWNGSGLNTIYSSGQTTDEYYYIRTETSSGKIVFDEDGGTDITSAGELTLGNWHHVVVTKNGDSGTNLRIYIDGVQDINSGAVGTSAATGQKTIGVRTEGGVNRFWDGLIDEVKIYNYPLTLDEIRENYNAGGAIKLGKPTPSSGAPSEVAEGLVGWWKMDEADAIWTVDGDIWDYSGFGNHGSSTSATATSTAKFGRAGEFDGTDDYVDMGDVSSLSFERTDPFSMSAWVKTTNNGTVAGKTEGSSNYRGYDIYIDTSVWDVNIRNTLNTNAINIESQTDVNDGNWHHLAFTYDGSSKASGVRLYVDGLDDTGNIVIDNLTDTIVSAQEFRIAERGQTGSALNGQIDEVKVWNIALSPDQIMREYAEMKPPVAHWKFDDRVGDSAKDSSGQGNDADLAGSNPCPGNSQCPAWESQAHCKYGSCLEFDSSDSDYVSTADLAFGDTAPISICGWAKVAEFDGNGDALLAQGTEIVLWLDTDYVEWILNSFTSNDRVTVTTETVRPGNWYHVCGTYASQGDMNVYLDGRNIGSATPDGAYSDSSDNFDIGYVNGIATYYDGLLDDIKVFDYALTPRQVAQLYNDGKPVGYWKFDKGEGGTAYDWSGNSNHGTLYVGTGGVTATSTMWTNGTTGKINGSLDFDGTDDSVKIGDVSLFEMTNGEFGGMAWIKMESFGENDNGRIMGNLDNVGDTGWDWQVRNDGGSNTKTIQLNIRDSGDNFSSYSNINVVDTGNWYHIAFTSKNGVTKFYVNGVDIGVASYSGGAVNPVAGSGIFYIGRANWGDARDFEGQIDEVKVFNYALTPEDIKREYTGGAIRFGQ